jgi:phenylpropionate dioxygenase-like ring-hydroxylating dioxygenase large terminal subunit
MDAVEDFDRASCRLPELRSELWEGWIFVNFDADAEALAPKLAPLSALLAPYRMVDAVAVETAVFDSPFNWKVLVDNFMEAYHHIGIHRETFEPVFPAASSYAPDNEGPYSVLVMPGLQQASLERGAGEPRGEAEGGLPLVGELDAEERNRLVAAVVYPFHLFAPSAQLLTWYQLLPHSWDRFTLRIYSCFPRTALDDRGLRDAIEGVQAFTRHVHHEDIRACEATWSGLNARSFESGRLAPLEKPLWQFNQWWIERMGGAE